MKLLKIILVALCLTSVALADNGNDYVRQLEPNGVFVDPLEEQRLIEEKMKNSTQKVRIIKTQERESAFHEMIRNEERANPIFIYAEILFFGAIWFWVGNKVLKRLRSF